MDILTLNKINIIIIKNSNSCFNLIQQKQISKMIVVTLTTCKHVKEKQQL